MIAATYVISLRESMSRWRAMELLLERTALPRPVRWESVDGLALDERALRGEQERGTLATDLSRFAPECRMGEIGCALGHLGVLRKVVEEGWPAALVLEDDVVIAGDEDTWRERFAAAYSDLPATWEIWYLYRCLDVRHRVRRLTANTVVPWAPLGGAAYAVTRSAAEKLVSAISPLADAIDRTYARLVRAGTIEAYAASPMLFSPGAHSSIINRGTDARRWITNGVNRPPEYWPAAYYRDFAESRWRRWDYVRAKLAECFTTDR